MIVTHIKTFNYPNFEVQIKEYDDGQYKVIMEEAYTYTGDYIGTAEDAKHLSTKYGIDHFEKRTELSNVTSVGFCSKTQIWYGWSHRAIFGFRVGSRTIDGKHISTLEQAKLEAQKFAESVS